MRGFIDNLRNEHNDDNDANAMRLPPEELDDDDIALKKQLEAVMQAFQIESADTAQPSDHAQSMHEPKEVFKDSSHESHLVPEPIRPLSVTKRESIKSLPVQSAEAHAEQSHKSPDHPHTHRLGHPWDPSDGRGPEPSSPNDPLMSKLPDSSGVSVPGALGHIQGSQDPTLASPFQFPPPSTQPLNLSDARESSSAAPFSSPSLEKVDARSSLLLPGTFDESVSLTTSTAIHKDYSLDDSPAATPTGSLNHDAGMGPSASATHLVSSESHMSFASDGSYATLDSAAATPSTAQTHSRHASTPFAPAMPAAYPSPHETSVGARNSVTAESFDAASVTSAFDHDRQFTDASDDRPVTALDSLYAYTASPGSQVAETPAFHITRDPKSNTSLASNLQDADEDNVIESLSLKDKRDEQAADSRSTHSLPSHDEPSQEITEHPMEAKHSPPITQTAPDFVSTVDPADQFADQVDSPTQGAPRSPQVPPSSVDIPNSLQEQQESSSFKGAPIDPSSEDQPVDSFVAESDKFADSEPSQHATLAEAGFASFDASGPSTGSPSRDASIPQRQSPPGSPSNGDHSLETESVMDASFVNAPKEAEATSTGVAALGGITTAAAGALFVGETGDISKHTTEDAPEDSPTHSSPADETRQLSPHREMSPPTAHREMSREGSPPLSQEPNQSQEASQGAVPEESSKNVSFSPVGDAHLGDAAREDSLEDKPSANASLSVDTSVQDEEPERSMTGHLAGTTPRDPVDDSSLKQSSKDSKDIDIFQVRNLLQPDTEAKSPHAMLLANAHLNDEPLAPVDKLGRTTSDSDDDASSIVEHHSNLDPYYHIYEQSFSARGHDRTPSTGTQRTARSGKLHKVKSQQSSPLLDKAQADMFTEDSIARAAAILNRPGDRSVLSAPRSPRSPRSPRTQSPRTVEANSLLPTPTRKGSRSPSPVRSKGATPLPMQRSPRPLPHLGRQVPPTPARSLRSVSSSSKIRPPSPPVDESKVRGLGLHVPAQDSSSPSADQGAAFTPPSQGLWANVPPMPGSFAGMPPWTPTPDKGSHQFSPAGADTSDSLSNRKMNDTAMLKAAASPGPASPQSSLSRASYDQGARERQASGAPDMSERSRVPVHASSQFANPVSRPPRRDLQQGVPPRSRLLKHLHDRPHSIAAADAMPRHTQDGNGAPGFVNIEQDAPLSEAHSSLLRPAVPHPQVPPPIKPPKSKSRKSTPARIVSNASSTTSVRASSSEIPHPMPRSLTPDSVISHEEPSRVYAPQPPQLRPHTLHSASVEPHEDLATHYKNEAYSAKQRYPDPPQRRRPFVNLQGTNPRVSSLPEASTTQSNTHQSPSRGPHPTIARSSSPRHVSSPVQMRQSPAKAFAPMMHSSPRSGASPIFMHSPNMGHAPLAGPHYAMMGSPSRGASPALYPPQSRSSPQERALPSKSELPPALRAGHPESLTPHQQSLPVQTLLMPQDARNISPNNSLNISYGSFEVQPHSPTLRHIPSKQLSPNTSLNAQSNPSPDRSPGNSFTAESSKSSKRGLFGKLKKKSKN